MKKDPVRAAFAKARKPTARQLARVREELRYYSSENVLKDFPSKRERAAMAAMWRWLSMHGIVAWNKGNGGQVFDTAAWVKGRSRLFGTSDAVVFREKEWRAGEAAFDPERVKEREARKRR
jgi:hypothetical protein